ncbi:MAG: rRNA maturation RNase YbeY [Bradyrhizobiaceae bacterium]|nr:rRNA maturation RNase YbeY [Bradyrhizobiaceae bacterium]
MVDVLIVSPAWQMLPEAAQVVQRSVAAAAAATADPRLSRAELCVLLCDDDTITALNGRWRGQETPTNVLSFPALPRDAAGALARTPSADVPSDRIPLGDIAVAAQTLAREAAESGKTAPAHLAHLVVHGLLHLVGYDHETDDEAEAMERLERDILARISVADPYAGRDADI